MKRLVLYDKTTGETAGYIFLATDSDAQFYPDALEIPLDHPGRYNQENWHVRKGELVHKKTGKPWRKDGK